MASYRHRFAISAFTAQWTRERWGIDCEVLYPPVNLLTPGTERQDRIACVGRFSGSGVSKRQQEMVSAFVAARDALPGWRMTAAGGLTLLPEDAAYHDSVCRAADSFVAVAADPSRADLDRLLGTSRVFWHAAGLHADVERTPELAEHFGMATVEAMSGGCVPVVIGVGGQVDIVEHGVSGFLCSTIEEMVRYTIDLSQSPELLRTMSAAAVRRAQRFSAAAMRDKLRAAGLPA